MVGFRTAEKEQGTLLVGLHIDGAADDDLQEQYSPFRGLLGAALYRVKHAPHLPGSHLSQLAQEHIQNLEPV